MRRTPNLCPFISSFHFMKQSFLVAIGAALITSLSYCTEQAAPTTVEGQVSTSSSTADQVKRGEYIVAIAGCNDCHSPKIMTAMGPAPDPKRLMSGHPAGEALPAITDKKMIQPGQWVLFSPSLTAAVGPWGTSFAANLTPDDTGIGAWTEAQFFKALREGKSKGMDGTRPLLPPMPWPNAAAMNDEDLRAMFAYLKSLPPVNNVVPNPLPPTM